MRPNAQCANSLAARNLRQPLLVSAVLCVLAWFCAPVWADVTEEGQFLVRSAYTQQLDGVYYVSAQIDYGLSEPALQALSSGVPLVFEVQIEVSRQRRFMPDTNVATLNQSYELLFHALTERYIVRNINIEEQKSFSTLAAALRGLGQVQNIPVIDSSLLDDRKHYDIKLRSSLDIKSFPGPLRLLASLFRFNDWRLASKWHSWALNP